MMKYKTMPWLMISHFVKKTLKRNYPRTEVKKIVKNAHRAYKNLLNLAEDIGYDNPMAHNLYMALAFFSFHVGNDELIKKDELKIILDEFFENKLIYKYLKLVNINKANHFKKFKDKIKRNADWIEKRRDIYPGNWDFDFETDHTDGLYYRFTICPIAKFFKDNGYDEYTPMFCALDYKSINLMHGNLYRSHTIAEGHGECDFWIVPDKIEKPS